MVYITHIRLSGGTRHEHITDVKWHNPTNGKTGESTKQNMVDWLRTAGNNARVKDQFGDEAQVGIVEGNPPYLRTHADGKWTDNLLALPKF